MSAESNVKGILQKMSGEKLLQLTKTNDESVFIFLSFGFMPVSADWRPAKWRCFASDKNCQT